MDYVSALAVSLVSAPSKASAVGLLEAGFWASDEPALADHVWFERFGLVELRAELLQDVFEQERHDIGQPDRFLLLVRETGNTLAREEWRSVVRRDVLQHGGSVAHEGNRLAVRKRQLG